MGIVFQARDNLKRLVALKFAPEHPDNQVLARFRSEPKKMAGLNHPSIVQVYRTGEHQGNPYFAMELMAGGSLERKLATGWGLSTEQAAQFIRKLAQAIHHAHQNGIIHRDLKPGNILLSVQGEPKIADFGLAKDLNDQTRLSETGQILGTVLYMSPEQAAGKIHEIGEAADIYALGAILYELLAGRPPFRGASMAATLDQILHVAPPPLQPLNPRVDACLDAICRKCLQKEPQKRYASALELAADLLAYLEGRPIKARAATVREQIGGLLGHIGKLDPLNKVSRLYYLVGALFFICWVAVFFLTWHRGPEWLIWMSLAFSYPGMFIVYCWHPRPTTALALWAHRQWWSLWSAQAVASLLLWLAYRAAGGEDYMASIQAAYPAIAGVTAVVFFGMGSVYWGRHYVFSFLFLAFIVPAALLPTWAPLGFAVLAFLTCIEIARSARHSTPSEEKMFERA
jgi:eukaryotic-like serine/threonine-protein kinase